MSNFNYYSNTTTTLTNFSDSERIDKISVVLTTVENIIKNIHHSHIGVKYSIYESAFKTIESIINDEE